MSDTEAREMRDMLVRIESGVGTLVTSSADHEARLRVLESKTERIDTQRKERDGAYQRLLAVGMLLAAAAGVVGSLLGKTLS